MACLLHVSFPRRYAFGELASNATACVVEAGACVDSIQTSTSTVSLGVYALPSPSDELSVGVGDALVTISSVEEEQPGGGAGGDGEELLLVTVYEGDAATAVVSGAAGGENEEEAPLLVSSVVDVVGNGNGSSTACGGATQCVNVTLRLASAAALTLGGAVCAIPTLLGTLFGGEQQQDTCVAGCCREGLDGNAPECDCNAPEVRGELCDRELRCSAQVEAGSSRDTGACDTHASGGASVTCVCHSLRRLAVFAYSPGNTVLPKVRRLPAAGEDYGGELKQMADAMPTSLPLLVAFAGVLVLLALVAWRRDSATLYTDTAPQAFSPKSVGDLFRLNMRLYSSIVRPFNVVPGWVYYTRLQFAALFAVTIALTACCALLFAGVDQCNEVRALTAALFSAILSSVATLLCRLSFKSATKRSEAGRAVAAHRKEIIRALRLHLADTGALTAASAALRGVLPTRSGPGSWAERKEGEGGAAPQPCEKKEGASNGAQRQKRCARYLSGVRDHARGSPARGAAAGAGRQLLAGASKLMHTATSSAKRETGKEPGASGGGGGTQGRCAGEMAPRLALRSVRFPAGRRSRPPELTTSASRDGQGGDEGTPRLALHSPRIFGSAHPRPVAISTTSSMPSRAHAVTPPPSPPPLGAHHVDVYAEPAPQPRLLFGSSKRLSAGTPSSSQRASLGERSAQSNKSGRSSAHALHTAELGAAPPPPGTRAGSSAGPKMIGDIYKHESEVHGLGRWAHRGLWGRRRQGAGAGVSGGAAVSSTSARSLAACISGRLSSGIYSPSSHASRLSAASPSANPGPLASAIAQQEAGGATGLPAATTRTPRPPAAGTGGAAKNAATGGAAGTRTACVLLRPEQLFVARGAWSVLADGTAVSALHRFPDEEDAVAASGGKAASRAAKALRKRVVPRLGFCVVPSAGSAAGAPPCFVPVMHVGAPPGGGCGGLVRVTFSLRMVLPPYRPPTAAHAVPGRPPVGSVMHTAATDNDRAHAGVEWPGLVPTAAQPVLLAAWALGGACIVGSLLLLFDLACVGGATEEDGGWNGATTRAFLLSLIFSFLVADLAKVLALTFLSASLLPGFLSPRAKGLRLGLRGAVKVLEAIF